MRPWSRALRVLKWAALAVCVSILSLSAASCVRGIGYVHPSFDVYIMGGELAVESPSWLRSCGKPAGLQTFEIMLVELTEGGVMRDYFSLPHAGPGWVRVPLGLPFCIVLVASAALWWLDRRRIPAGHCRKCGYNLTGNGSGRCPECGEAV